MASYLTPEPTESLLGGITPPAEVTPTLPPEATKRQAAIAALATTPFDQAMELLDERTATYAEAMNNNEGFQIRLDAAAAQQDAELRSLGRAKSGIAITEEDILVQQNATALAIDTFQRDVEDRARTAVEEQAVKNIRDLAATGDYNQAKFLLNNLEHGDAEQRIYDFNVKQLTMKRLLEEAQIDAEDQPWFAKVASFVMQALPFNSSMSDNNLVDLPNVMKNWYGNIFSGEVLESQSDALNNLSVDEYQRVLQDMVLPALKQNSTFFGFYDKAEELRLLTKLSDTPTALETNIWNTVDAASVVPFTKVGKFGEVLYTMGSMGARKQATEKLAEAALNIAKTGEAGAIKATEVVDNLAPSIVNPGDPSTLVPMGADAVSIMEKAKYLIANLTPRVVQERMVKGELAKTIEVLTDRAQRRFGNQVKDVSKPEITVLPDGSNVKSVILTLGKVDGGLYSSEKTAKGFLKSTGYKGTVIKDPGGGYAVKIPLNIPESGFYTELLNVKANTEISRFLLSSRLLEDTMLADYAQVAGNSRNKTYATLTKYYADKVSKLGSSERWSVAQVAQKGANLEKWWTREEFDVLYQRGFNRAAKETEWDAYNAMREVNDIEFTFRNSDLYKNKVIHGYETVTIKGVGGVNIDRENAIVDYELKARPTARVYVPDEGRHYTHDAEGAGRRMSDEDFDRYKQGGYQLVTVDTPIRVGDGGPLVKNFLVKGVDMEIEPLRWDQMKYRAGGHRMYEGKYFAKQTAWSTQPDTGVKFLRNPTVFANGTRSEMLEWTSKMEQARLIWKERPGDLNAIDELFDGNPAYGTGEDFAKNVEDGLIDLDEEIKVYFDREMPDVYITNPPSLEFVDLEEGGFNGVLRTNGRMYYSGKGQQLKDWRGELAPTLDPFETIDRSLTNIANLSSFSDYKVVAIERFKNTFKDRLEYNPKDSDFKIFMDAKIRPDTPGPIKAQIDAQRDIIRRNLGWKSETARRWDEQTRRFAEFVVGTDPNNPWTRTAEAAVNWVSETNPLMAMRGLAFDMKLGFFNPVQFPLQIQTSIAALTLSPKLGWQGMQSYPFMRMFMRKAGGDQDLAWMIKNGHHKLMGFTDEADFKDFMKSAKDSGFLDIGGAHALINDFGTNVATDAANNAWKGLRENGRFFFNEAEVLNRSVAYRIAWGEVSGTYTRNLSGPIIPDRAEFLRKVAGRAEEYAFSMSRESSASWQQGLMSIPTQFFSYQARMLEAMLGPQFTLPQKLRLIAGQGLLYGSFGVPVMAWISQKVQEKRLADGSLAPDDPAFNSMIDVLDRGLYDWALSGVVGADLRVGKRMGSGDFLPRLIEDILGTSQYGEKSLFEIFGGATVNIGTQVAGVQLKDGQMKIDGGVLGLITSVGKYSVAESGGDIGKDPTEDSLKRLAMNVSTLSLIAKSQMILEYGKYESNRGTVIATDLPSMTAFALLLGAEPAQMEANSRMLNFHKNRDATIKEASGIITKYRSRMVTEPDNLDEIMEEINIYVKLLPPDIRKAALRKAQTDAPKSMYDGLVERTLKVQAERENIGQSN